jgi:hypothetical protein
VWARSKVNGHLVKNFTSHIFNDFAYQINVFELTTRFERNGEWQKIVGAVPIELAYVAGP